MIRIVVAWSAVALAFGCSETQSAPELDDDATLRAELAQLADLGYSAVEIQPFMSAVTNADLSADSLVRTVGEARFLERLVTAACAAQELGLSWDLTLGSGWSTGGPDVGDDGARQLLAAELTLMGPGMHQGPLRQAGIACSPSTRTAPGTIRSGTRTQRRSSRPGSSTISTPGGSTAFSNVSLEYGSMPSAIARLALSSSTASSSSASYPGLLPLAPSSK